jgi:hypothetical protein
MITVMQQVATISVSQLQKIAEQMYGSMIKAVVDVEKQTLMIDAELHADLESALLESGSKQQDLWGINLYPADYLTPDFIEFDSMINIRPRQNNRSRSVEDEKICEQIIEIVKKIVHE